MDNRCCLYRILSLTPYHRPDRFRPRAYYGTVPLSGADPAQLWSLFRTKTSPLIKTGSLCLQYYCKPAAAADIKKAECDFSVSIKRGEIYYADLSPVVGSEQGGVRPVLIVQNDVGNKYSPTVIAAAITSRQEKSKLPTHIELPSEGCGLTRDSVVLLEQIRTIDKRRLGERMGSLDTDAMSRIDQALSVSFGLGTDRNLY